MEWYLADISTFIEAPLKFLDLHTLAFITGFLFSTPSITVKVQ